MPEPDHRLVPVPSGQLVLASNHLALLNKILPPAVLGPVPGRPWEIVHLGLKLVWIEPGTFLMGSADCEEKERPVTRVTLTHGFWLGRTQVTQAQWAAVMGSDPSNFEGDGLPVENVSWDDAMAFCQKLTERTAGRLPTGYGFTLPTEAQWEYACRAGTTGDYAGDLDAMAWYDKNSGGMTHPVGGKQPNAWGLYDMHGNVWEWCLDWWGAGLRERPVANPTGPASGTYRVSRGGCWGNDAPNCPSALPNFFVPGDRLSHVGFRLAISSVR